MNWLLDAYYFKGTRLWLPLRGYHCPNTLRLLVCIYYFKVTLPGWIKITIKFLNQYFTTIFYKQKQENSNLQIFCIYRIFWRFLASERSRGLPIKIWDFLWEHDLLRVSVLSKSTVLNETGKVWTPHPFSRILQYQHWFQMTTNSWTV